MSSNIVVKTEVQKIVVKNADGKDGKSAYMQAVEGGYTGTEQEFNCSLSLLSDVADGKKQIADAINTKGGSASADSSFSQLAEDIENLNDSFITYGVTADPKIDWLQFICRTNTITRSGLQEIKRDDIEQISNPYAFYNCINLRSVSIQSLTTISGEHVFSECSSLQNVNLPGLTTISGEYTFFNCSSLQSVELPNLVTISRSYVFNNCSSLQSMNLPNLVTISQGHTFQSCSSLQSVEFGTLMRCVDPFTNGKPNLRNITIGQGTDITLLFQYWTATSVIAEGQSGIDELNNNLRTNLLEKLADHSTDGQTRTLRLGWLARVTQENIDYANSKGWTLTT